MFAKLLKMEFRSTWNILGILCVSLVGAGLLGAAVQLIARKEAGA